MEARLSIVTLGLKDLHRSYDFYHKKLSFPACKSPNEGIVFFKTAGVCLAVYPIEKLAEDIGTSLKFDDQKFSGVTLAHNVREKFQVAEVLAEVKEAGGKVVKDAQDTFWGGHSGYFTDPDN